VVGVEVCPRPRESGSDRLLAASHGGEYPLRMSRYIYAMATCRVCAQGFTAKRSDARYCSPACRQKAYRDRHVWVRWVRLTEQMVGRYPDEAGAEELRELAGRFLAIVQAQQTKENDQDEGLDQGG
jgi:hypothetical protein